MADAIEMIMPMLREMRAEHRADIQAISQKADNQHEDVVRRLEKLEAGYKSAHQAMTADTLRGKLLTGEFQERIQALEKQMELLRKNA